MHRRFLITLVAALAAFAAVDLARAQTALVPTQLSPADATQPAETRFDPSTGEVVVDADVFYGNPGGENFVPYESEYGGEYDYVDPGYGGDMGYGVPVYGGYGDVEYNDAWTWQVLPDGLIYRSYLAGQKEPRLAAQIFNEKRQGSLMDATIGARVGIFRYGTTNAVAPEGWELDVEAAAFPRITFDRDWDLVSSDFRAGIPLTWQRGKLQAKVGYYHLSSHLGDEQMIFENSLTSRINYVRDAVVFGVGYFVNPALRLYSEAAWAFYTDGGAEPWEIQAGLEYSSIENNGLGGSPFFAVNTQLFQEQDFSGYFAGQLGWQWRGRSGQRLRVGAQYLNGSSPQFQFFNVIEEQIGGGIWYDF